MAKAKKRKQAAGVDPEYLKKQKEALVRRHRQVIYLNDSEMAAIRQYCEKFRVGTKAVLFREAIMEKILKELDGKKVTIQRSKGLGENDPEMMWLTTMNPETRRLIKVMPSDVERTAQVFDLLLGDNLSGRKEHIADNGYKYLEMADIS